MKYEKNEYSDGFQICSWVFAAAFMFWGIQSLMGYIGSWWGWICIVISLSTAIDQIRRLVSRGKLRNIIKGEFTQNPNITIEEIYANSGISHKDVKAIIMDLKGAGWLRGSFNSATGKANIATPTPQGSVEPEKLKDGETPEFCPHCGTSTEEGATFCSYCGMKIKG